MSPKPAGVAKPTAPGKFQPRKKQPVPIEERLKRLFASLCAQIDGGHFTNAIKTCNKILRCHPADKDALQAKLFLLLQTEQYEAALSLTADSTGGDDPDCTFEEAYATYRLHREEEAAAALCKIKGSETDHRGVLHLEAQSSYRQGKFESSLELYNELLATADPQSEEYSDILTNLTASQKHLDFINTGFLHVLDALPSSIVSTIETSPPPSAQPAVHLTSSAALIQESPDESAIVNKTKSVRLKRVPKGVIPGVTPPPDPERWLKKSERTSFGQAGRKRKGAGGATQGVILENTSTQSHSGKSTGGGGASHNKGKKKK